MLFSRPIARNVPHFSDIRYLYRAACAEGAHHCPFGMLVAMNRHSVVDFRAYFDEQNQLRGLSLCTVSGGLVLVSLIVVCDCAQNEKVTSQILSSLECRYQGMAFAVDSGGVMSLSASGVSESLVPVLRGAGYREIGVLARDGRCENPVMGKGHPMSTDAAKSALRGMPASLTPSLVRA